MAIVMIGNPNVGKSSVLNRISGSKIFVSNYSGTSIELTEAKINIVNRDVSVFDTPGIYSIYSPGEEPRVVREVLEKKDIELILNVIDATNIERNLVLTFELMELNIPMVLVINQIDRARSMGLKFDHQKMLKLLNCPIVFFSAASGEGLIELMSILEKGELLSRGCGKSHGKKLGDINRFSRDFKSCKNCSIPIETCFNTADLERAEKAQNIARMVSKQVGIKHRILIERIQGLIDKPFIGTALLLLLAYIGFLLLLQTIEISEGPISSLLVPVGRYLEGLIAGLLPPGMLNTVLSKAVPEGLIIPFSIIMPAMLMVSLLMSIIEDTGLLPRYSVALERVGRLFGVSGQAVIPLSLGFGCRTPAILATRILPGAAERFIIITILSIVIPCAATIGILASVISTFYVSLTIIVLTMLLTLIVLGFVLSRLMKTDNVFVYELPPLRIPQRSNVWNKVKIRFSGFFTEVLPLLLLLNIIIRALMESGLLNVFSSIEGFTRTLFGIPAEAFVAVLITIFQRYLAPLVLLNLPLTTREATIAISMIALSLPCLPVMVMIIREIRFMGLIKILLLGFATSFTVGIILNLILPI